MRTGLKKRKVSLSSSSIPPSLHLLRDLDDLLPALCRRSSSRMDIDRDSLQVFHLLTKPEQERRKKSSALLLASEARRFLASFSSFDVELTPSEGLQPVRCKISSGEHCYVPKLVLRGSSEGRKRWRDGGKGPKRRKAGRSASRLLPFRSLRA